MILKPKPPVILPCPFCANFPALCEVREVSDGYVREHGVRCDECGIGVYAEYESEVVEQWNRRPNIPHKNLEELRASAAAIRQHMPLTLPEDANGQIHFARALAEGAADAIEEILGRLTNARTNFQARVELAHAALFEDDPTDVPERVARFFEEANEACQALGMTREDAHALVDYTYSRPIGEPAAELGAAAVTLTSLCIVADFDLRKCAEDELVRLQLPETIEKVRAKRANRHGRGPLPGFIATEGPQP